MALITSSNGLPTGFRAGDVVRWTVTDTTRPPSSHSVEWFFTREGYQRQHVVATESGNDYSGELTAQESRKFTPGEYSWFARYTETSSGDTLVTHGASLLVRADPELGYELSFAEEMLREVRAVMLRNAGKPFNSADIFGTTYDYKDAGELRAEEQHWMGRVRHERKKRQAREDRSPWRHGRRYFSPSA